MSTKKSQSQRGEQNKQVKRDELQAKVNTPAGRSARTLVLVAVALAFAVVMIVLTNSEIGEKSGRAESQNGPRIASPREAVSIASSLLAGIQQHGNVLGKPTAPITLEFFGNFECLSCREFAWWGMRGLIETWILAGKMRIEYHPWPGARNNFAAFREQQVAALAAGKQNKMWNFIETSYFEEPDEGKSELPSNYMQGIAAQVPGLNLLQWDNDLSDTSLARAVIGDVRLGSEHHFRSTPAFLFGKTDGPMREITGLSEVKVYNMIRELLGT